jgi:hypothetical protein
MFLPHSEKPSFHEYKIRGKIIVLCMLMFRFVERKQIKYSELPWI